LTSVTATVKACVTDEPSWLVARTVRLRLAPASKSIAPATVMTPVEGSMANAPPALSSRL